MSLWTRSIPLYTLILFSAYPACAGQSTVAPAPSMTQSQAQADHQTYRQRADGEMQEWETRLHAFNERAKADGQAAKTATAVKLQAAWDRVKQAKHGLETAGSNTWEGAQHAYEAASNDLTDAWRSAQRHL